MADHFTPQFHLVWEPGASFLHTWNWYGGGAFYAPIEDIRRGVPTQIKVTGHGLPTLSPTPVFISDVASPEDVPEEDGMRRLNTEYSGLLRATVVDADWFELPVNTNRMDWDNTTGYLAYSKPSNYDGWQARMMIRKRWNTPVLHESSTANGQITLNSNDGSISVNIPPEETELLTFGHAVFQVEVFQPGGVVVRPLAGTLKTSHEVVR